MKRAVNANMSKIDQIRTGATRKTDLGTKENKGVIHGKDGKYKVVETEKKFEEAGVKKKKRNYVMYESKLGTEKEKNLQKIHEAPKPQPKPKPKPVARPRVEEKIIQKKKRIEYLDNYQYHESKVIRNPNRRPSIVKHKRLGPEVGGFYEEMTYQKQSTRDSGRGPVQYSKQTTTTSRRGPAPAQKTVTTSRTMPAQPREYRNQTNNRHTANRSSGSLNATKTTTTTTTVNRRSNSRPQDNRGNRTTTTTTKKTVTRSSTGRRH